MHSTFTLIKNVLITCNTYVDFLLFASYGALNNIFSYLTWSLKTKLKQAMFQIICKSYNVAFSLTVSPVHVKGQAMFKYLKKTLSIINLTISVLKLLWLMTVEAIITVRLVIWYRSAGANTKLVFNNNVFSNKWSIGLLFHLTFRFTLHFTRNLIILRHFT